MDTAWAPIAQRRVRCKESGPHRAPTLVQLMLVPDGTVGVGSRRSLRRGYFLNRLAGGGVGADLTQTRAPQVEAGPHGYFCVMHLYELPSLEQSASPVHRV